MTQLNIPIPLPPGNSTVALSINGVAGASVPVKDTDKVEVVVTVTPPVVKLPDVPTGLTGTATSSSVSLAWSQPNNNAASWNIWQSQDGDFPWVKGQSWIIPSAKITGLAPNIKYQFICQAQNAAGVNAPDPVKNTPSMFEITTGGVVPPPTNKPGPTNTGPRIARTPWNGSNTFTSAQIVTGKKFIREVSCNLPNGQTITFVDCEFDGNNNIECLQCNGGSVVLDHCKIYNATSSAIAGDNIRTLCCDIGNMPADCIKGGSNCVYDSDWLHDYGTGVGSHGDAIQISGQTDNLKVQNVFMDAYRPKPAPNAASWCNSCTLIKGDFGTISNIVFDGVWFGGGCNYPIYVDDAKYKVLSVTVKNSHFLGTKSDTPSPSTYQYGNLNKSSGCTWTTSGNVDANGKPVNL